MADDQLSARSGFNTGVEPQSSYFIDKATQSPSVTMKGLGEVTLLEGNEDADRTLTSSVNTGKTSWPAFGDPAAGPAGNIGYETRYYNTFGDAIVMNNGEFLAGGGGIQPVFLTGLGFNTDVLVQGEKITIKRVVDPQNSPSLADAVIFPHYVNLHKKPRPAGGGGGLTDGNVVVLREIITPAGVVVGPPPGKAWRPVVSVGKLFNGLVGNFSGSGVVAEIKSSLIDADGVEWFIENVSVNNGTFKAIDDAFFATTLTLLSYPNKLKYKLVPNLDTGGFPTGRVLLMTPFQEFDIPADV